MATSAVAEALIGLDFLAEFRGRYGSYADGLALAGARSVRGLMDLYFTRTPCASAQRGDIAYVVAPCAPDGRRRGALMVVTGAVLAGHKGAQLPRDLARICWKVG